MNFTGLQTWLTGTVLVLVLIVVGVILIARSGKGDHKGAMTTIGIALLGLFLIGIAITGSETAVATWVAHLVA